MFNQWWLQWQSAETSTASSTTCLSFSKKVVRSQTPGTSSWETLLTEASTQWRPSNFYSALSSSTHRTSHYLEATTRLGKSLPSMASMMRPLESMEMLILGNTALRYSTTLVSVPLLKVKSFASMVVFHQKSKQLIKLDLSTEEWKSLMKVHSVT